MNEKLDFLKQKSKHLPFNPGVYIMKDKTGHIIYIGKAKALRKRVMQYFWRFDHHEGKVRQMVENVNDFEYILTDSEFEALVLECSLIKQHRPKYNILLKDDKGYSYIRISLNEPWPRIASARKKEDDGALYLGPYMSNFTVSQAVDQALKAFQLPSCTRRFPQEIGKGRPCLNYFLKQCSAPCRGKMGVREYRKTIDDAVAFLKGGFEPVIELLTAEMEKAAEAMEYEKAAKIRDRIIAVSKIKDRQKVVSSKVAEQDVIGLASDGCNMVFEVFIIRNGRLADKNEYVLDFEPDEKASRAEFIRRYYSLAKKAPKQITLDGETEDKALLEQYLTDLSGHKVRITVPQKGEQLKLAEMTRTNAQEHLSHLRERPARQNKTLDELQTLLGLSHRPDYIEAYDISHTAGTGVVAGMVVFENGKPQKSRYKKFMIKTVIGQDDYASMNEVLERRLRYLCGKPEEGKKPDAGFLKTPDLILLDGGKGQISAVRPVLEEFKLDIPLFGMVKDDKHRTRAIAADGGEIAINSSRNVFTLISEIQEEVHRFSVSYHHKTQKKSTFSSKLLEVPGIGETRLKALLKQFKTIDRLKSATVEELLAVKGMNKTAAEALIEYLNH